MLALLNADYVYHTLAAKASGELCLKYIFSFGAFARMPLVQRSDNPPCFYINLLLQCVKIPSFCELKLTALCWPNIFCSYVKLEPIAASVFMVEKMVSRQCHGCFRCM